MGDSPLILGVSGLRGIVGESLTPEVAERYAAAFSAWLRAKTGLDHPSVAVGRDGRKGGDQLAQIVMQALSDSGCVVYDCRVAMTPSMGHEVDHCLYNAAIVVTASHNPQEWNGLKLIISGEAMGQSNADPVEASAPAASVADEIIQLFDQMSTQVTTTGGKIEVSGTPEESHSVDVLNQINIFCGKDIFQQVQNLKVVVDSVNCSGAIGADALARDLKFQYTQLHGDSSGIFPHTPEPTKENLSGEGGLCDVVPSVGASVGFAQDPDADRLAIVDERGEYIGEEYTLVLCAMALMEARGGGQDSKKGKPVFVVNLSTSRMIDDVAAHYGAEVVRSAVGEANVVEVMKSLKAQGRDVVMGGEGNGGVIWAEVTYVRDSLSGMALVLSLMARTGKTVSELVEMVNSFGPTDEVKGNGYTILKAKSDLASKADAVPVVKHLDGIYSRQAGCRVDLQDGIRIDWDERGVWAHVRASNTEPIMRVIVEAPSKSEAERVAGEIDGHILGA